MFVLSSSTEASPTVLIEVMAIGIPVVSTNCESGSSEILADGTYGWLVPVGDKTAMAEAMLKVLSGERKPIDVGQLPCYASPCLIAKKNRRSTNITIHPV